MSCREVYAERKMIDMADVGLTTTIVERCGQAFFSNLEDRTLRSCVCLIYGDISMYAYRVDRFYGRQHCIDGASRF